MATPEASIAVLPFADMSPGRDQEYFADGVAEEILNALTRVRGLKVVGRTSSFSFKGKTDDLRSIGRKLGAATVLEGSVRKDGGRVRVTAQLVKAADGYQLWSENYDRELAAIFSVQDEIANTVAAKVLPFLVGGPAASPSTIPAAYDHYLLGRSLQTRYSSLGQEQAIHEFEAAIALDRSYGPAWAGLARALVQHLYLTDAAHQPPQLAKARKAADQAVALAPELAASYAARAVVRQAAWEWDGARADARRTRAIDPGSAETAWINAQVLVEADSAGATELLRKAIELDPLASLHWSRLGQVHFYLDDLKSARQALRRAIEIDPRNENAIWGLAKVEMFSGRPQEARRWFERSASDSAHAFGQAVVEHALGHDQASRDALAEFTRRHGDRFPSWVAEILAYRGERDAAFLWLERAYERRDAELRYVRINRWFKPLRSDPRWSALLSRMKLPVE